MASTSSTSGITSERRVKHGLCLLSLDGGGVRGPSTLYILKRIMHQINRDRQGEGLPHVEPCDVFDLIGGTSTGGLIAIMLGRLQMDIESCINAYSELARSIFSKKGLPIDIWGHVKGRYKSPELENAVKRIIKHSGSSEDELMDDRKDRGCRVFVCAVRKENKAVAHLRAYQSDTALVADGAKIWEAARATSAASGFFDPIRIGKHGQEYVDAGLGCNNPVDEVWTEAQDIWSPEEDLASLVKCFISIGTGDPGTTPIEDGALKMFSKTLTSIVTETEKTAENFAKKNRSLFFQRRYFRFNVDQRLQAVGLEEYKKEKEIVSATSRYMESLQMQAQTRNCSQAMVDKALFSILDAPEIDYFVGRSKDLESIESVLRSSTAVERKIVFLHGLGGIGKSQLAIEFAKKHRFYYSAVLWLNAKTEDTLKRSFAANARRLPKGVLSQELLDGPQHTETLNSILREMKTWFSLPDNDRWLLIYDNVDNPKIPDNKRQNAFDIRPYFPEAHQGSILVTTRWRTLRIGHPIEIKKLSKDEENISLLNQTSGRAIGEDPTVKDLTRKLDGLPLALATAGSYLGLTGISVSEYLGHYEASWLELQRASPGLPSYEDQTIYSTWNLSYIYIRNEDESAAKLLELWAYFDNQDLWYDLLKGGKCKAPSWFRGEKYETPGWLLEVIRTRLAFNSVMGKLRKHALIEKLTESDGYSMHHCVHAWAKTVLCKAVEAQKMILAVNCIGESVLYVPQPGDWLINQRLIPHAEKCFQLLRKWGDRSENPVLIEYCVTCLSGDLGHLYRTQGKLKEAESMCQRALLGFEKFCGKGHINIMNTINNLSAIYYDQGKLAKSESMLLRVLAVREKVLGRGHLSTSRTASNLGTVYRGQGKMKDAESMYHRALLGHEKVVGKDHILTMEMVHDLGILYSSQGKLVEAESMLQRALAGKEKALGRDHTDTLTTASNLGAFYYIHGTLEEAESMYLRAFQGYTRNPPPNPKDQLDLLYVMGLLYRKLQDFGRAKEFFGKAHEGYQSHLGPQHPETVDALDQLNKEHERDANSAVGSNELGDLLGTD